MRKHKPINDNDKRVNLYYLDLLLEIRVHIKENGMYISTITSDVCMVLEQLKKDSHPRKFETH